MKREREVENSRKAVRRKEGYEDCKEGGGTKEEAEAKAEQEKRGEGETKIIQEGRNRATKEERK